jgi:hypothetical protein
MKKGTNLGDLGIHRIHLARDMDKWQAVVNTVMKIRFPQNA